MFRKKLLIANWKLNHNRTTAVEFFREVLPRIDGLSSVDSAVAPVAPMLDFVGHLLLGKSFYLAAQNVFYADKGAFTGEWSAENLGELGVKFCLVGHSERRHFFCETDEDVEKKARALIRSRIAPVICVGESAAEREQLETHAIIKHQVQAALKNMHSFNQQEIIFAYEPIWAIGTGKTASPHQAQEVHQLIRMQVQKIAGEAFAKNMRILYGGSVNAGNIKEIASLPDIDGALVGGASLQAASFLSMVEALHGV